MLHDLEGNVVAKCLDRYDLAASKIVAGRPKDIEFLSDSFESGLMSVDDFLERVLLIRNKLENDALKDRLKRLLEHLGSTNRSELANVVRAFVDRTF